MADNKKSFLLYCDLIHTVNKLSNADAGKLFIAILDFTNGNPAIIQPSFSALYLKITKSITCEWGKYNPKTKKYHWNYKGGITPENKAIRNSELMKLWRHDVFTRDNFTCQTCYIQGGMLHAHHIKEFAKFPLLRFDINNGLTVCKSCHNKIHSTNG